MRILVIGSGLMGPAAAYNAMSDPEVTVVTIADRDPAQLAAAVAKLAPLAGSQKVQTAQVDLQDQAAAAQLMGDHDVVVAAIPSSAIPWGIRAAVAAHTPWVDLSWPPAAEQASLGALVEQSGVLVVQGCGVEPGLTEIMARHLAEQLDRVDELHIKCGGIPVAPAGALQYKIVFGGRRLPLRPFSARIVENGALVETPRYSGVETFTLPAIGELEAWHEGFMPWLLDLAPLKGLKLGTQKTVRWPGFGAKASVLRELGLLSLEPVDVDGVAVIPKHVVDAVLYPQVKMEEADRDLTIFRVDAIGVQRGAPRHLRSDMVDRYDEVLGFTSMARVTAFTGAIVARMIARGEIAATGWRTPEQLVTGAHLDRLLAELAANGIRFTQEQV